MVTDDDNIAVVSSPPILIINTSNNATAPNVKNEKKRNAHSIDGVDEDEADDEPFFIERICCRNGDGIFTIFATFVLLVKNDNIMSNACK